MSKGSVGSCELLKSADRIPAATDFRVMHTDTFSIWTLKILNAKCDWITTVTLLTSPQSIINY